MKGTFYYIRVHKNPTHYHIIPDHSLRTVEDQQDFMDAHLQDLLLLYVQQLQQAGSHHHHALP